MIYLRRICLDSYTEPSPLNFIREITHVQKEGSSFLYSCRMSTGGRQLTQAIDVGGERFLLSSDKSIDLAYKGKKAFRSIFDPIAKSTKIPLDRIEELFRTYLPYPIKGNRVFIFPSGSSDKEDLLRILEGRVNQITETRIYTLLDTSLIHVLKNLLEIIDQIESGSRTGKPGKKRKPLTENEIFSLILEFSWYLMHPNQEMNDEWESMIKKLDTKSLDTLVREIDVEEEKRGPGPKTHKTALNYFQNIDLSDVIHQPTKDQAMKRIKNAILFPGSESGKELKTRLKNLMNILKMKGYIEEPLQYTESIPVIKNKDLTHAQYQMPKRIIKGGVHETETTAATAASSDEGKEQKQEVSPTKEIALSLGKAMTPFFDYFKEMYDPIYGFVETAMEKFEKENSAILPEKLMHEFLSLLYVSTHLPLSAKEKKIPKGVYHIQNVDPIALKFVSFMLTHTNEHIDSQKEQKDEFLGQLFKLPVFRLSTFKGKTITKAYTNAETLPYIQFMMLDHNLFKKKEANFAGQNYELVKGYQAIQEDFKENELYLIVSDSNLSKDSLTPMNLYQIDYSTLQLDKTPVDVKVIKEQSSEPKPMLEQGMKTSDSTFNQGELIMCILQTLKKQIPQ